MGDGHPMKNFIRGIRGRQVQRLTMDIHGSYDLVLGVVNPPLIKVHMPMSWCGSYGLATAVEKLEEVPSNLGHFLPDVSK